MLIVGCAKKVEPTPEIVEAQPTAETVEVDTVETPVEVVISPQIVEVETVEVVIEISVPTTDEDAEAAPLVEEVVETPPTPQKEIKPSFDFDQVFPDSVWTNYMTKRGDYLSLIAYNEYDITIIY